MIIRAAQGRSSAACTTTQAIAGSSPRASSESSGAFFSSPSSRASCSRASRSRRRRSVRRCRAFILLGASSIVGGGASRSDSVRKLSVGLSGDDIEVFASSGSSRRTVSGLRVNPFTNSPTCQGGRARFEGLGVTTPCDGVKGTLSRASRCCSAATLKGLAGELPRLCTPSPPRAPSASLVSPSESQIAPREQQHWAWPQEGDHDTGVEKSEAAENCGGGGAAAAEPFPARPQERPPCQLPRLSRCGGGQLPST